MLSTNPTVEQVREYSRHATEHRAGLTEGGWQLIGGDAALDLVCEDHQIDCARCGDVARLHVGYGEMAGKEPNCPGGGYCSCYIPIFDQLELYLCTHCAHQTAPNIVRAVAKRDTVASTIASWRRSGLEVYDVHEVQGELDEAVDRVRGGAEILFAAVGLDAATVELAVASVGITILDAWPTETTTLI